MAGTFPLVVLGESSKWGVGCYKNLVGLSDIVEEFLEDQRCGLCSS